MSLAGRAALALVLLLACAAMAGAHPMNLSTARINLLADRQVEVEVAVRGSDADRMAGTAVFDAATEQVRVEALAGSAGSIAAYVLAHAVVALADGRACHAGAPELRPDGDGVAVRARWSCPAGPGQMLYRSTVLTDIDPAARQVVLIHGPEGESQMLLTARENELVLSEAGPPEAAFEVVRRYLLAGIEHIFLGYDHIAFLLALVLWARRLWPVAKIVTAFTLAHSVTLSLAALGVVELPSAIVEPAIAASIVFVAVENFVSRDIEGRWRVSFLFGLVHGFGFAGALQEFGLPREALVTALAAFNAGVEIGQVAIVALLLPALLAADRIAGRGRAGEGRRAPAVHAASGVIGLLGCYWFLERTILA